LASDTFRRPGLAGRRSTGGANAATAANRGLREQLVRAEERVAALEARIGALEAAGPGGSVGAPGAPPGTPPAGEPATPAGDPTSSGGPINYEIVRSDLFQLAGGGIRSDFAQCPSGSRAVGGGLWTGTLHLQNVLTNDVQQVGSWPAVVGGNGRWYVRALNPAAATRSYYVYAACVEVGS
jgi:hypothetical protein